MEYEDVLHGEAKYDLRNMNVHVLHACMEEAKYKDVADLNRNRSLL